MENGGAASLKCFQYSEYIFITVCLCASFKSSCHYFDEEFLAVQKKNRQPLPKKPPRTLE